MNKTRIDFFRSTHNHYGSFLSVKTFTVDGTEYRVWDQHEIPPGQTWSEYVEFSRACRKERKARLAK